MNSKNPEACEGTPVGQPVDNTCCDWQAYAGRFRGGGSDIQNFLKRVANIRNED
jgi:hypothetical protein